MTDVSRNLSWRERTEAEKRAYREGALTALGVMLGLGLVLALIVI